MRSHYVLKVSEPNNLYIKDLLRIMLWGGEGGSLEFTSSRLI